ncbi:MAG: hypothetical protein F6K40_38995 [Okeania sp. SIO3I5]|uniref:hypothetical protein n=1 Tax=Okeania sp. SIO3I5 TaxID=2607805 RepID=UPI0013BB6C53|nr:hypothetical protein [Okeania sp. SIO3I5]NEQ41850.1 hypothetical protein [Okeania sp. SIO3I5]
MGKAKRRKLSDPNYGKPTIISTGELCLLDEKTKADIRELVEKGFFDKFALTADIVATSQIQIKNEIVPALTFINNDGYIKTSILSLMCYLDATDIELLQECAKSLSESYIPIVNLMKGREVIFVRQKSIHQES